MAEAIGLIASVIQVAGAGLKLSQTLYQYADGVATADRRIKDIAKEIQLTSFVIEELGDVFKHDETSTLMSKNAVKTANETMKECSTVFAEIDATLKKSKKNTLGRLMLPFRDNKIELLRNHIDKLKSTLQLLMQVLTHAHQVATKKLDREAEAKQKAQIQELIELKKKSTKKYEESLRNISLSDGSTIIDPDEAESDKEDLDDEPVRDLAVAAAAIGSTITPKTLATCVQHIRSLLEDIETLQQALTTKVEGDDHSEHHQSLIGSYFRARGHLDSVLFSGSQAQNTSTNLSTATMRSIDAQVDMKRVTTGSTLNEGLSKQVTLTEDESVSVPQTAADNTPKDGPAKPEVKMDELDASREATQQDVLKTGQRDEDVKEVRKAPMKLQDNLGSMYSLPYHTCTTWERMHNRLKRIYSGEDFLGNQIRKKYFDVLDSDGYIILDEDWEDTIAPGMSLTLRFWNKTSHAKMSKNEIGESVNETDPVYHVSQSGPVTPPSWSIRGRSRRRRSRSVIRRYHSQSRERSESRVREIDSLAAIAGVGALAYAAGRRNKDKGTNIEDYQHRSRSRTRYSRRGRSRSLTVTESDSSRSRSRSMHRYPRYRNNRIAQVGVASAAVAGLAQHQRQRSKSRKRGGRRSRSRSRIREGVPIAAAGVAGAAVTGLYEKHKAKMEARALSRSRSSSQSREGPVNSMPEKHIALQNYTIDDNSSTKDNKVQVQEGLRGRDGYSLNLPGNLPARDGYNSRVSGASQTREEYEAQNKYRDGGRDGYVESRNRLIVEEDQKLIPFRLDRAMSQGQERGKSRSAGRKTEREHAEAREKRREMAGRIPRQREMANRGGMSSIRKKMGALKMEADARDDRERNNTERENPEPGILSFHRELLSASIHSGEQAAHLQDQAAGKTTQQSSTENPLIQSGAQSASNKPRMHQSASRVDEKLVSDTGVEYDDDVELVVSTHPSIVQAQTGVLDHDDLQGEIDATMSPGEKNRRMRVTEKWEQAAKTAFVAGAVEAFRSRKVEGPWTGAKGQRIATATLGTAGIDSPIDRDREKHEKRHIAESALGGLAASRLANGSRSRSRARGGDGSRSPSRSRSRSRSIFSRSRSRGRSRSVDRKGSGDRDPRKRQTMEAALGGLAANRLANGPRSRSQSRSRSRDENLEPTSQPLKGGLKVDNDPYRASSLQPMHQGQKDQTRTEALQADIDATVAIMHENINKVSERGEKLDSLQEKTDDLAASAATFRRAANKQQPAWYWPDPLAWLTTPSMSLAPSEEVEEITKLTEPVMASPKENAGLLAGNVENPVTEQPLEESPQENEKPDAVDRKDAQSRPVASVPTSPSVTIKPSHEYGRFKQQTGLSAGSITGLEHNEDSGFGFSSTGIDDMTLLPDSSMTDDSMWNTAIRKDFQQPNHVSLHDNSQDDVRNPLSNAEPPYSRKSDVVRGSGDASRSEGHWKGDEGEEDERSEKVAREATSTRSASPKAERRSESIISLIPRENLAVAEDGLSQEGDSPTKAATDTTSDSRLIKLVASKKQKCRCADRTYHAGLETEVVDHQDPKPAGFVHVRDGTGHSRLPYGPERRLDKPPFYRFSPPSAPKDEMSLLEDPFALSTNSPQGIHQESMPLASADASGLVNAVGSFRKATISPRTPADKKPDNREGLVFITDRNPEDFKSKKVMTAVRKKAMYAYLKSDAKPAKESKTPTGRSRLSSVDSELQDFNTSKLSDRSQNDRSTLPESVPTRSGSVGPIIDKDKPRVIPSPYAADAPQDGRSPDLHGPKALSQTSVYNSKVKERANAPSDKHEKNTPLPTEGNERRPQHSTRAMNEAERATERRRRRKEKEREEEHKRAKEAGRPVLSIASFRRPSVSRRGSVSMTSAEREEQRRLLAAELVFMQDESTVAGAREQEKGMAQLSQQQDDPSCYDPCAATRHVPDKILQEEVMSSKPARHTLPPPLARRPSKSVGDWQYSRDPRSEDSQDSNDVWTVPELLEDLNEASKTSKPIPRREASSNASKALSKADIFEQKIADVADDSSSSTTSIYDPAVSPRLRHATRRTFVRKSAYGQRRNGTEEKPRPLRARHKKSTTLAGVLAEDTEISPVSQKDEGSIGKTSSGDKNSIEPYLAPQKDQADMQTKDTKATPRPAGSAMSPTSKTPTIRVFESHRYSLPLKNRPLEPHPVFAIPRARDEIPPPLPPPRHIEDSRAGQDPSWKWGHTNSPRDTGFSGNRLATVRPGSSLYGSPDGAYLHARQPSAVTLYKGRKSSQFPDAMSSDNGVEHLSGDERKAKSRPSLGIHRFTSERQLADEALRSSSEAYDKSLLSKLDGHNTQTIMAGTENPLLPILPGDSATPASKNVQAHPTLTDEEKNTPPESYTNDDTDISPVGQKDEGYLASATDDRQAYYTGNAFRLSALQSPSYSSSKSSMFGGLKKNLARRSSNPLNQQLWSQPRTSSTSSMNPFEEQSSSRVNTSQASSTASEHADSMAASLTPDEDKGDSPRSLSPPIPLSMLASEKERETGMLVKSLQRQEVKSPGTAKPDAYFAPSAVDRTGLRTPQDIMRERREREEARAQKLAGRRTVQPAGLGGHTQSSIPVREELDLSDRARLGQFQPFKPTSTPLTPVPTQPQSSTTLVDHSSVIRTPQMIREERRKRQEAEMDGKGNGEARETKTRYPSAFKPRRPVTKAESNPLPGRKMTGLTRGKSEPSDDSPDAGPVLAVHSADRTDDEKEDVGNDVDEVEALLKDWTTVF